MKRVIPYILFLLACIILVWVGTYWLARPTSNPDNLHQFPKKIEDTTISADGKYLLTLSEQGFGGATQTLQLWDIDTKALLIVYRDQLSIMPPIHFIETHDTFIGSTSKGYIGIWSLDKQEIIAQYDYTRHNQVELVADLNENVFISRNKYGDVIWRNACTNEILYTIKRPQRDMYAMCLSPDQQYLIWGDLEGNICIWSAQNQAFLPLYQRDSTMSHSLSMNEQLHQTWASIDEPMLAQITEKYQPINYGIYQMKLLPKERVQAMMSSGINVNHIYSFDQEGKKIIEYHDEKFKVWVMKAGKYVLHPSWK